MTVNATPSTFQALSPLQCWISLATSRHSTTCSNTGEGYLFRYCLQTGRIEAVLNDSNHPGSGVKGVATFGRNVLFTDRKARKLKEYDPYSGALRVILGDGQKGERDGRGKTCKFVQLNGVCTLKKTIFLTDVTTAQSSRCLV